MINIKVEGLSKNKNGNMETIDFVKLIHTGQFEEYMRCFSTLIDACPPEKLLRGRDMTCFMCVSCQNYAASKVKEYQKHYMVGKEKFLKEELDNEG